MSRRRRPLAVLALMATALIVTAALISGCGSSAPAVTGTGSGTGTGTGTGGNAHQAVKFAECMRDNGVGKFPDPNASGKLTIDEIANGSSLDTSTPAFKHGLTACKDLEPAGFMGRKRSGQQQDAALKFARCIRENGVKDFPDPVNGQPLVDTNRIPSSATSSGMSILNAAMQKCRDVAAAAGVTR